MKIIIFGSTGGTGSQLISQALEQDYEVTAFARNPKKIKQSHKKIKIQGHEVTAIGDNSEKLNIIEGDVLDVSSVEQAIQGHDAVLCSLGMSNIMDKSKLRANGTLNIIQAMQKAGVKRLICQSALGTGDSKNLLPFHYRFFIAPLFMHRLYEDHLAQETHIKKSQLEWVIVRPAVLTDGESTGSYQTGVTEDDDKAIIAKISRADTADFMLKQLTNESFLYKTPYISY